MSLQERLLDSNERFSPSEIYQLFELLADEYGFHRSPELPVKGQTVETASMTLEGFEKFGVLIVRPRTNRDTMLTIPGLVDKLLLDNFKPSQGTAFNANLIALAMTVIIAPIGVVEKVLSSDDDNDMNFFFAFAQEYAAWMKARADEAAEKKSGQTTGKERVLS